MNSDEDPSFLPKTGKLMREALHALVKRESGKRLFAIGGSMPDAKATHRRIEL